MDPFIIINSIVKYDMLELKGDLQFSSSFQIDLNFLQNQKSRAVFNVFGYGVALVSGLLPPDRWELSSR